MTDRVDRQQTHRMSDLERVVYLARRGWRHVGGRGPAWFHPAHPGCRYTMAAAYRAALADAAEPEPVVSMGQHTTCGHWMPAGKQLYVLGDGRRVCAVHLAEWHLDETAADWPQYPDDGPEVPGDQGEEKP